MKTLILLFILIFVAGLCFVKFLKISASPNLFHFIMISIITALGLVLVKTQLSPALLLAHQKGDLRSSFGFLFQIILILGFIVFCIFKSKKSFKK